MNKGEKYIVKLNQKTAHFGADYLPMDGIFIFYGFRVFAGHVKMVFLIPTGSNVEPVEFFFEAIDDIIIP